MLNLVYYISIKSIILIQNWNLVILKAKLQKLQFFKAYYYGSIDNHFEYVDLHNLV